MLNFEIWERENIPLKLSNFPLSQGPLMRQLTSVKTNTMSYDPHELNKQTEISFDSAT